MTDATAVIMAAGKGTRMKSDVPKVLHELCGRPLIGWVVAAAEEAGIAKVVVVDGPDRDLEGHLPEGAEIAVQQEAKGTADAVLAAKAHFGEGPVLVLSGDVPLITAGAIAQLIAAHDEAGAAATMMTMELDDPAEFGRVVRDKKGNVEKVVEAKASGSDATPDQLAIKEVNTGIYVFDGKLLEDALTRVPTDNAQGEAYLPDALVVLSDDGRTIAAHVVDDHTVTLGINDRVDLAAVRRIAQRRINEQHMRNGVGIVDPDTTYIDVGVTIGHDTRIEPGSTIKTGSTLGANCTLRNVYIDQATVEDNATIGPFAYLRPGTVIRAGAKVGTFVEIKNSDIGPETKVPHLSYIGDADVGGGSNLAAATITANYDFVQKNRTTIGDRVRTSVDTTLVAPVTLGDDSYTAAGSVITDDIPAGALGVARERQRNIEGYDRRRKDRHA
jgi:bifunctional UDP-N-acetylglucosamine pyrophosphorylase/glucosamine-1-phosphate N-acetyltransferase